MTDRKRKNKTMIIIIIFVVIVCIIGVVIYINYYKNQNKISSNRSNNSRISAVDENKNNSNISTIENNNQEEQTITKNDKVTIENFCEFNIVKNTFSKQINPANPTGYYHYLEVKDADGQYFDLVMNIKNLQSKAVEQNSLVSVKLIFDNNYEYICSTVTEEDDGSDIETYTNLYDIEPLKTKKYHFAVEVPAAVASSDKPLKAIINANGNSYTYIIR